MKLIGNGMLFTNDNKQPFFDNGAICIKDGLVKEIGEYSKLKEKYSEAEFIDAKGKIIMPGLINVHTHIYSSFARGMPSKAGLPAPTKLTEILEGLWWRLDKGLTPDDVKYSAYTTYMDCIRFGVTTTFDHHASPSAVTGSLFTIADAAKEIGIRSNMCYEVSDRDGDKVCQEGIKENIDFIKYANKNDQNMVKGMFGLHAPFTLSDKTLDICAAQMEGMNAGYHVHIAEGIEDLYDSLKKHGKRLVDRLMDFNILGEKTLGVHCIYINEHEMDVIRETKTSIAHNPESNMGNACGCSPAMRMMAKGINVGLGTDGYTHDMFESVKVANILHKHHLCDPNAAWSEVPQMIFQNNQKIAGQYFADSVGALKEGAAADIIIVDYKSHTPMTGANFYSHMLFGMMGRCVTDTIVAGKQLMKDRILQTVDEDRILARSRELATGLWKRIN